MQRNALTTLSLALILGGSSGALAQAGDLGGVTMRVLDDLSDIDAVVLDIRAERGATDEGGDERRDTERDDAATAGPDGDAVRAPADRHDLEDAEDEEHGEGELEDNDVEQPPAEAADDTVVE
jgi:hypothetical protein